MERVLDGIRVLDFSRFVAAPYCGLLLADMGAEVIRVESPGGNFDRKLGPFAPNNESLPFSMIVPRNKKGITLKLRSEKGKEIFKELVKNTDIILHNFTSGSMEAKILNYESLKEINPGIILVSVTGFGATGINSHLPCFDSTAQALSGGMIFNGFPDTQPTRSAVAYVDICTGVYAAYGASLAIQHRLKTGEGQVVDISLLDVASTFISTMGVAAEYQVLDHVRPQIGNSSYYNYTDSFEARDGWLMISVITNSIWYRFLAVIGREDLKGDSRFRDDMARFDNRDVLNPYVSKWMKERTVDEVISVLGKARVPCGKVNSIPEMVHDQKNSDRDMIIDLEYPGVGKVPVPGVVTKMSKTPGRIDRLAARVGEHNDEIYCDLLGLTTEELEGYKSEGIV